MAFRIDEYKIAYFDALPGGARPGSIDDFHTLRKKHTGMPFLCLSPSTGHYVLYRVTDSLTGGRLKFFIDLSLIFIFESVPDCVIDYYNDQ